MKANNEPYSKRGFIILLIIWFLALTWIFLKQYWQFMFWLLIILWTLGYKEISLRIASWSKRPTIKEFIIILLLIFIYLWWHWFLEIKYSLTAIPFGIVFANYIKLFLPKWSNWKSDLILIVTSINFIILAIYLAWVGKILNYYVDGYDNRVSTLLEEGLYLHRAWKDIEAIWEFNKIIELEPKNVDAYFWKWTIVHQLWRYEEALEIFNRILTIDPNNQATHFSKWLTLQKLNRLNESIISFDKAIELDPNDGYAYFRKWDVLYQLGNYDSAMTLYEKSININPDYDLHYYSIWGLLSRKWRNREAMEMIDKCLRINPENTKCQEAKKQLDKIISDEFTPLFNQFK